MGQRDGTAGRGSSASKYFIDILFDIVDDVDETSLYLITFFYNWE